MDEIANLIGCKPNFLSMMFTDPKLAWKCFFGPFTPPQFRLRGPHSWDGARQAIEDVVANIDDATCTRRIEKVERKRNNTVRLLVWIFALSTIYATYRRGGNVRAGVADIGNEQSIIIVIADLQDIIVVLIIIKYLCFYFLS